MAVFVDGSFAWKACAVVRHTTRPLLTFARRQIHTHTPNTQERGDRSRYRACAAEIRRAVDSEGEGKRPRGKERWRRRRAVSEEMVTSTPEVKDDGGEDDDDV